MARQERAIRTRSEILRAAGQVFGDLGYEATTIADILARAGVTKGALYFHFSSKEELAQGLLDAQVDAVPEPPHTGLFIQSVIDRGMLLAHLMPRDPLVRGSIRLAVDRQNWPGALHRTPYVEWSKRAMLDLRHAASHSELLPHAALHQTAELLVGSFTGLQLMSHVVSDHRDLEERVSVLYNTVLPAVVAPAVVGRLDMAPGRGERVLAALRDGGGADASPLDERPTASGLDAEVGASVVGAR